MITGRYHCDISLYYFDNHLQLSLSEPFQLSVSTLSALSVSSPEAICSI